MEGVRVADNSDRLGGPVQQPSVDGAGDPGVAHRFHDKPSQLHWIARERTTGIEPGQQGHILYETAHSLSFRRDSGQCFRGDWRERSGDMLRVLGVAADDGDRSSQLVARVRGEPPQLIFAVVAAAQCGSDMAQHAVKRIGDLAHFGAPRRRRHVARKLHETG